MQNSNPKQRFQGRLDYSQLLSEGRRIEDDLIALQDRPDTRFGAQQKLDNLYRDTIGLIEQELVSITDSAHIKCGWRASAPKLISVPLQDSRLPSERDRRLQDHRVILKQLHAVA